MTRYTHAVVVRLAPSIENYNIKYEKAKEQHTAYVSLLREIGLDVIELPSDEKQPEGVFVEDAAVICNGVALISKSSNSVKQNEANIIRSILIKELEMPIIDITDSKAELRGGDVLFTGREFFVGLSNWTNESGAKAIADAFPEYPCVPIKVKSNMRLKHYVTMAGCDILCVSNSAESQEILKRIEREASFSYQTLTLPEEKAANVLFINGNLIHCAASDIPESCEVLQNKEYFSCQQVDVSELCKFSTGITSCCLLLKKSKLIRSL